MLTLNSDKTKVLVSCEGCLRGASKNIIMRASQYIKKQSSKIKVLGIYITNTLDNQANINNIIQKVNYRSSILREIFKYCSFKTKHMLSTSIILSTFRYVAPLLIYSNNIQIRSLHILLMKPQGQF